MIDFPRRKDSRDADFSYIQVRIASPEEIRNPPTFDKGLKPNQRPGWSHGEVTKPETINYRSYKPEPNGLFCQRIFGPQKDWECGCGKYKRIRFRGIVCDRCGVEVTLAKVRRERMGHIEMAVPVSHIWFLKTLPSQLGYLLGMKLKELEKVIYYANYVVTNPGSQDVEYLDLLDEDEYYDLRVKARLESDSRFKAEIGAEGARTLLQRLDFPEGPSGQQNRDGRGLDRLAAELRDQIANETSQHRKKKKLRRLKVVDALRNSGDTIDRRNRPEWMIMEAIPVIPPDLRPLVPLDGGRFATSDLNDLYRRVINRNNRLKKLMNMGAPEVILRNEKRMLQESVDALFDNGRRSKAIRGRGKRPLKSLSDMLKGKQGRFRQNLLGKRVDYSGRSVIVVGPELKLHQCGLPKAMAVELFKPFIIHELEKRGEAETVRTAKKIVEDDDPKVYEVLEDIIRDHPVLLNRAPTLHRIGIQAFEPVLVEGKAIRIHPLVCTAFNADFDGDQMAVHLPLSYEAQLEARVLMLSSNNILLPSNGRPVASPSQDMVIGSYYLTKPPLAVAELEPAATSRKATEAQRAEADAKLDETYAKAPRFSTYGEVEMALMHRYLDFWTPCWYWGQEAAGRDGDARLEARWIRTTVGRVLFNSIIPDEIGFLNRTFGKKELGALVFRCFTEVGLAGTVKFLDDLKDFGFRYATQGGLSVGIDDLEVPPEKTELIKEATDSVKTYQSAYDNGYISNGERYNKIIDTWTHANNDVADAMVEHLERSKGGFNPVYMMMTSGARGNRDQMRQLAGMRGLMAKPQKKLTGGIGEIIENPIRSNFREGLTVVEYFISTHGARKGLADTALKTADAGYLTRRLVDVAQDVTISEDDCYTVQGVEMSALKEGEDIVQPLADRIVGNAAIEDVCDPIDGELIVAANALISEAAAEAIENAGIQSVKIRSVLTCETKRGICRTCYGRNLATMGSVDIGEAVGIIAAQSIGEPGTQLTLRTFHIGGTAARIAAQNERKSKIPGVARLDRVTTVTDRDGSRIVTSREGSIVILTEKGGQVRSELSVPYGATIHVEEGDDIETGNLLFSWDPYSEPIVADSKGVLKFVDIVEDQTVREEFDESTGRRQRMIIEDRDKRLHPTIQLRAEVPRENVTPHGGEWEREHVERHGAEPAKEHVAETRTAKLEREQVGEMGPPELEREQVGSRPAELEADSKDGERPETHRDELGDGKSVPESETHRDELGDGESAPKPETHRTELGDRKPTPKSEVLKEFIIPVGAQLMVADGAEIHPGDPIAKIGREVYKTRDITGGLPRVAELFEARSPKDPAVVTEIDGSVSFGNIKRGKREVIVTPAPGFGKQRSYDVPVGKHMRVHQGDQVEAGDRLSEGPINPHDILRIKGPWRVQEYLLNEIQEVYRLQGVTINDKHIAVIVRQMLQKVRVVDSGQTHLLQGEHVDRIEFREVNEKAILEGKKAAISEPLLLGITKASLTTDSFISAASFQETTRVLTDAAVRGAKDGLKGLKENIIIGHLVPAGTGLQKWDEVEFGHSQEYYDEQILPLTLPGDELMGLGEATLERMVGEVDDTDRAETAEPASEAGTAEEVEVAANDGSEASVAEPIEGGPSE